MKRETPNLPPWLFINDIHVFVPRSIARDLERGDGVTEVLLIDFLRTEGEPPYG